MGFDDLAKHMASRDGRKKLAATHGSADEIVAEAAKAARRMSRTRDLILGPLLLVGGLTIAVVYFLTLSDIFDPPQTPVRATDPSTILIPVGWGVVAIAMVLLGTFQTVRGLRGRSP